MADSRNRRQQGAAMTGAGTVLAGTGLLAGGIPGAPEPRKEYMFGHLKGTSAREMASRPNLRHNLRAGKSFPRAGILGFRAAAHDNVTSTFKEQLPTKGAGKVDDYGHPSSNYLRGHLQGKIKEEERVLHGLRRARRASYALTVGGAGLALAGAHRKKQGQLVTKRRGDTAAGTAAGSGAALASVGHFVPKALDRQGKKFERKAITHVEEAQRLAPHFGGVKEVPGAIDAAWGRVLRKPKKMMEPVRHDKELRNVGGANDIAGGPDSGRAMRAGHLRGRAGQEKHFAEVFQNTSRAFRRARTPGLLLGAAGAGGLLASRDRRQTVGKFIGPVTRHAGHATLYTSTTLGASNLIGQKKKDTGEGNAAALGALGGQGLYQGAGKLATVQNDKYARGRGRKKLAAQGLSGTKQDKIADAHFEAHGLPNARKVHHHDAAERYRAAFRSYPKELPGAKVKRVLARTHSGRSGDAVGATTTIGGGLLAMRMHPDARKARVKQRVGKSREYGYMDRKRSTFRTAELGAGLGIGAWGASRLHVGPAVARGVKIATEHGQGKRAESLVRHGRNARDVTQRGTGRAERVLRDRVPGFGTAMDVVPAKMRPAAATAGGALLAARAVPTHDERFTPTGSF